MDAIILCVLALFFYALFRMMWFSYLIEHLRRNGAKPFPKNKVILEMLLKRINNHMLPIPYFEEYMDTEEIKQLIKKRNRIVAVFWAFVIIGLIVQIFIFPEQPKETPR